MRVWIILVLLVSGGAYHWWSTRPIDRAPGVTAPKAPRQLAVRQPERFSHNGYTLTPLAKFELEARVLGVEAYHLDRESELAPIDLALGWDAMSDGTVLNELDISQGNRFYYWSADHLPVARSAIEHNSANMHMIPADGLVEDALKDVRVGHIVSVKGMLVRADAPDGWHWVSSLRRDDTGAGACELVFVREISYR